MPNHEPHENGAQRPEDISDEQKTQQFAISLRRAFRTDLDAPLPDHIQQLVDALRKSLQDAELRKQP